MSAKVFHIPLVAVTPSFKLHSIVQRTPKPNDDAGKDHPEAKIYHDAGAMFIDPEIDIIIITTTPDTHFEFAKTALESGKHVLVEKPFVPTSTQASQLIEISKKTGKLICVYQNRRWDSDFLTFRKLQKEGSLGRIVEFESHFDRWKAEKPDSWKGNLSMKDAGGVVYDLGTHLLDQAYIAFGLPKSVTGIFQNQRDDGSTEPDAVTILLHYGPGGPLVTVKAAVISAETEQLRYWVRGTKGTYRKYHLDCQEDQLKAGLKPGDKGFGIEDENLSGQFTVMEAGGPKTTVHKNIEPETYAALYSGFAKAIESGDAGLVPVKAEESRDVLRIIEAAIESAKEGRTVTL